MKSVAETMNEMAETILNLKAKVELLNRGYDIRNHEKEILLRGNKKEMERALLDIDYLCDLALRPDEIEELDK